MGKMKTVVVILTLALAFFIPMATQAQEQDPRFEVAEYVRDNVLGGEYGNRTIWISSRPVDSTHEARSLDPTEPIMRFPYEGWMVMIDDAPRANFAHNVRWLIVRVDLGAHTTPVTYTFAPRVFDEEDNEIPVTCLEGATGALCPDEEPPQGPDIAIDAVFRIQEAADKDCLHAVLISGGAYPHKNFERYRTNLRSMYNILRSQGYAKDNIHVYYADGASLDLDNADGDGDDSTGSDVTDSADESIIRAMIQGLCDNLNPVVDYLFVYVSNHGMSNGAVCLYDFDGSGHLEADEQYSPAEMDADTEDCQVCRLFMLHDQCFSGAFLPLATDGNHDNTTIYAAATASESSYGREYLDRWEDSDHNNTTLEDLHQDVVDNGGLTSTPGKSEVDETNDQVLLGDCCVNTPPTADANGPYTEQCQGATTILALDGTGSSDPDDADTLTYFWTTDCPGGTFNDATSLSPSLTVNTSPGCSVECSVTLTVTDISGADDTDTKDVTISDNQAPVLTCAADVTIECDESTDPSNTGMATATDQCDLNPDVAFSDAVTPGACLQEETIARTWTASDECGNSSSCVQTIEVVDTTPPVIQNVTANPNDLWPPNHKMVQVTVAATATDNCDSTPDCAISNVSSNEPVNGLGDGNTDPDWIITGDLTVDLRAERSGTGDGRTYTITVTCTDECGNSSFDTTSVSVQHNQ